MAVRRVWEMPSFLARHFKAPRLRLQKICPRFNLRQLSPKVKAQILRPKVKPKVKV